MSTGRGFTSGHFAINVDGQFAAYVKSVDLGKLVGEVSTNNAGPIIRQKKHITKFKFDPTSFEFGLSHSNALLKWIQSSFDLNHTMKDLELTIFDVRMKAQRTVQFFNCHLQEFKLQKFDAKSAKEGLYATLKFQPEDVKFNEGGSAATAMVGTKQKKFQGTNFVFTYPGIDTTSCSSIEVPGITVKLTEHAVGMFTRSQYEANSVEFSDVKFTLSAHEGAKVHQLATKWLADGKRSEEDEVTANLMIKGPDAIEDMIQFDFENCGIKSVSVNDKAEANKDAMASTTVEAYCEQAKIKILQSNM